MDKSQNIQRCLLVQFLCLCFSFRLGSLLLGIEVLGDGWARMSLVMNELNGVSFSTRIRLGVRATILHNARSERREIRVHLWCIWKDRLTARQQLRLDDYRFRPFLQAYWRYWGCYWWVCELCSMVLDWFEMISNSCTKDWSKWRSLVLYISLSLLSYPSNGYDVSLASIRLHFISLVFYGVWQVLVQHEYTIP